MRDLSIAPLKDNEYMYTYRNSQQISTQTGLVGHLRADMGAEGDKFYSSWDEYDRTLNAPGFAGELSDVLKKYTAEGNFLSSRKELSRFCSNENNVFKFDSGREYGVRVDSKDYSYLMRLNPNKGEYCLYCYCYVKNWLDYHMKKAQKGIRFIDTHYNEKFRLYDGDKIIIRDPGERINDNMRKYEVRYIDDYHFEYGNNLRHICEFAEIIENTGKEVVPLRASLPEKCYKFFEGLNTVGTINKGDAVYTDMKKFDTPPSESRKTVDKMNKDLGVTPAQLAAMKQGARYGFDKPDADPKNYTEKGILKQPKHRNHEER